MGRSLDHTFDQRERGIRKFRLSCLGERESRIDVEYPQHVARESREKLALEELAFTSLPRAVSTL